MVGIFLDDRPAFLLGAQPTHAKLIRDRGVALVVGRIAGVERDSHARASSVGEAVTRQPGGLLLDEIARGLPGELADKIDEARVRFLSLGHARHGLIAGLGDQSKLRGCGLPLPSHPRPAC
ncbi:hypothetical protein [Aquamicrobium lusatiense]|uniref:hypothetical protein n=1 Tax=Aquamicrobium lusatiense TaxID=89772 RepID=UPI0031B59BD1